MIPAALALRGVRDVQALVRLREGAIDARTAAANRLRGLLANTVSWWARG